MHKNLSIEESFGQVIRDLRKERKITQEKLSDLSDLDRSFISQLEGGKKQPSLVTIFQLAKALNVAPTFIIAFTEEKRKHSFIS